MNLRDLEYTVCLAPEGQLRRAAERCHVSQPTMSAQIAKLRTSSGFNYSSAACVLPHPPSTAARSSAKPRLCSALTALVRAGQDPFQGPFHPRKVPDPNSLGETIRISCEPKMVRRTVPSKRERIMNLRCSPRPDPDDRKFAAEPASEPELRHLKQRVLISLRLARGALIVS